jgi:hypothetical protein
MEQTECSETSAYKIQTPGNYPEENIQNTGDVTKQTIHRTQKYIEQHKKYIEQHNN